MRLNLNNVYNNSFKLFCRDIVHQKMGEMHEEIINQLESGDKHLAVMAHRGSFKCVTRDTRILLANGTEKTVDELINYTNTPILSYNPISGKMECDTLEQIQFNKNAHVFRLTLQSGDNIKVTSNHPFYTADGWQKLKYLKKGDFVALPRSLSNLDNSNFTKEEMRLFGYLLGDGCLVKSTCTFSNIDILINKDFKKIIKDLGGDLRKVDDVTVSIRGYYTSIKKKIRTWLYDLGFQGDCRTKKIPDKVFVQNNKLIAELIKGYFSADGTVEPKKGVSLTSVNYSLLNQIKMLLLRFGIISTINFYSYKHEFYRLSIYGKTNILKFKKIGFVGDKQEKFIKLCELVETYNTNPNKDIVPFKALGLRGGTSYKGVSLNGEYGTSRRKVKETYLKTKDPLFKLMSSNDLTWVKIKSIKSIGKRYTYHLSVKKNKNFIGNGIISHNTFVMSRSFPLWIIYKERDPKTIIITSMNQRQARRMLGLIRDEIKKNDAFSKFRFKMDTAEKIEIYIPNSNEYHTIVANPLGTRGEHGDYVISDDVMKDDEGRTTASMNKLKETWWKSQFPMAMARGSSFDVNSNASEKARKHGKHLFIGTPIAFNDMFADIEKRIHESEIKDTEPSWKLLRYPALKDDGTPQFPEHYSLDMLMEIKESSPSWTWNQEYMLNPVGSEDSMFPPDLLDKASNLKYKPLDEKNKQHKKYYLGCDVAMSNKAGADYSAFCVVSKAPNRPIKVEHIWHEKGVGEDEQIEVIKRLKREYNITKGKIERKGITYSMAGKVVSDSELAGIMDEWNPTNENKYEILGNVQILLRHDHLCIPDTCSHYEDLINELSSFAIVNKEGSQKYRALTGHDDLVIGVALAISAAGGWVFKDEVEYSAALV